MRHDDGACVFLFFRLPPAPFSFDAIAPPDSQLLSKHGSGNTQPNDSEPP